jgi:hypothetical protein
MMEKISLQIPWIIDIRNYEYVCVNKFDYLDKMDKLEIQHGTHLTRVN